MRKLVTLRRIGALDPIPDADAIEVATIDGWKVVVKKGEFQVNQLVVYFEIDSWIPHALAPFLSKGKEPREYLGVKGERLKTIRLRGQLSQGLVLPLKAAVPYFEGSDEDEGQELCEYFTEGTDVSDLLNVLKYEKPLPGQLVGKARGNFPGFIQKTDQERCQNLRKDIFEKNAGAQYEVTLKLDGSSMTAYWHDAQLGVCSRNLDLVVEEDSTNSFVRHFIDSGLRGALDLIGRNVAVQGELMGPGIQGNRENLAKPKFFIFDIQGNGPGTYFTPYERAAFVHELFENGVNPDMVTVAPSNERIGITLEEMGITDIAGLLAYAEGPSINNPVREGVVFKRIDGQFSFKAISNTFLLKGGD